MLHRRAAQRVAVLAVALAVVSACSSNSSSGGASTTAGSQTSSSLVSASTGTTAGSSSGASSGTPSGSSGASAGTTLAELAAQKPKLPDLPQVSAPKNKSVWIISCSSQAAGCAFLAGNIQTVMENQLHWKVTDFDGKLTPATYAAGIQQALVAHADAIVLVAIDCALVKPALQKAKAANVPVVDIAGYDCSDPSQGGGESLVTVSDPGGNLTTAYQAEGKALADYVAVQSKGSARLVVATLPDFQFARTGLAAFEKELPVVCPGCKILAEAPALGADLATGAAAAKFSSALLQQPTANYVVAAQEVQLGYVTNALRTSTRKVTLLSNGGSLPSEIELIKNGQLTGMMSIDIALQAWVTTDYVVRSLVKAKLEPVQPVYTLVDKDHNLPASGGYTSTIGYQAAYARSWGVG